MSFQQSSNRVMRARNRLTKTSGFILVTSLLLLSIITLHQVTPSFTEKYFAKIAKARIDDPSPMIFPIRSSPALATTTTTSCQKLTVSSVAAIGSETGNPPSNAIDNNLNTRWSNQGIGSWIQTDLGAQMTICNVDIAWYNGNSRQNNFVISVSNAHDGPFTTVFTGKSSGLTLSPERYTLPANTLGKFVRITVNGNTVNNWASITEIAVNGFTTVGNNDKFGIQELYSTKSGGEEWYMNMQNPSLDTRTSAPSMTKNTDGSYNVKSTQVRLATYTSSGYHPEQIATLNQQQLAAKGYMQSSNDWKNVEITGYFKVNSYTTSTTNGAAHIELLARGGTHTSSRSCEGTAYHSNLYQTGRSSFEKELEHTAGYATNNPEDSGATSPLKGRGWIGVKAVFYTLPNGSVKLQQWIDDSTDNINVPGNKWHKLLEFIDSGTWGGGKPNCGGTPTTIITWGGPIVTFRWDNIDNMDIKNFSVREILSPTS